MALENKSNSPCSSSSSQPTGDRRIWDLIWKSKAPPKIKIFGWKLASKGLAVQAKRSKIVKGTVPTCTICGIEPETEYHATMVCPKARALRLRMEKVWNLPKEEDLRETGPEWALNILANQDDSMRCKILFLWWRAWHLRNNSIFGDGKAMINDSACFIENYYNTTMQLNFGMPTPDRKGKCLLSPVAASRNEKDRRTTTQKWTKPPLGWAKINTDASFISANGTAHWGAIVRDDQGNTISSAWSPIPRCSTVEEAEAIAVLEGLRLASTVDTPCCLEADCKSVTDAWNWDTIKRSQAGIVINEAKHAALSFQNLKIEFIPRSANGAAHRLAAFSRSTGCNGVLYGSVPECVLDQVLSDCNQNNIL